MDTDPTPAPPDAATPAAQPPNARADVPAAEEPRCVLPTDGPFHALMRGVALAVLAALALAALRVAVATLYSAARATGPGLWLATLVAGVVAETALHEAGHALAFRLAGLRTPCGVLTRRGVPLGAYCRPLARVPRLVMLASLLAPQVVVPAILLPLGAASGRWPLSSASPTWPAAWGMRRSSVPSSRGPLRRRTWTAMTAGSPRGTPRDGRPATRRAARQGGRRSGDATALRAAPRWVGIGSVAVRTCAAVR